MTRAVRPREMTPCLPRIACLRSAAFRSELALPPARTSFVVREESWSLPAGPRRVARAPPSSPLAALACSRARHGSGALLVDLGGDAAAALGPPSPPAGRGRWFDAGDDVPADGLARIEHELFPGLALVAARRRAPSPTSARAEVLAAVLAADRRAVVVDCGRVGSSDDGDASEVGRVLASSATHSLLVVRPCYLALRRATAMRSVRRVWSSSTNRAGRSSRAMSRRS